MDAAANGPRWKENVYVSMVLRLALVMVLYTVCRLGFYFFNLSFFSNMTAARMGTILFGGLRFDLSATLYSNTLFILLLILPLKIRFASWYQTLVHWIFVVVNAVALALNAIDMIYYRFTLRRTTLSVVGQFKNEDNLLRLAGQFLWDYWYAFLFWVATVAVLYFVARRIRYAGPQMRSAVFFYLSGVIAMLVTAGLFVAGARGGFTGSTRPITLSNAAAYAETPNDMALVLNTPFAVMRTAKANVIKKVNYFDNEQALTGVFDPLRVPHDTIPFRPMNVVVLILESFSKEFIAAYNRDLSGSDYRGYAPFLDSLIGVSRAYQYSLANGRKSIDAMPSVICSIPSIEVPYVLSHFSGNKINSLASALGEKGYYTAFFHGAPNGSMGFDAFANLAGFAHYYGKTEYGNDDDFDGTWGIWDEPFLHYFGDQMNTFPQPFFTTLFTVSSHHPYQLPDAYASRFKGGPKRVHRTIEYTDFALKKFFAHVRQMPWYHNTLFVITADHASAEIQVPRYNSAWGYFSIPIFFFRPGENGGGLRPEIVQQIDIMPSVLGYLHYDRPYVAFGRDIFHDRVRPFAFNYLNNTYQLFQDNYLFQFDGEHAASLYDFKHDVFLKENLLRRLPDTVRQRETLLKAFIQQYNNRMVDNDLTPEGSQIKRMGRK